MTGAECTSNLEAKYHHAEEFGNNMVKWQFQVKGSLHLLNCGKWVVLIVIVESRRLSFVDLP